MSKLVRPHGGGELKPLLLSGEALKKELARAQAMPKVRLSSREAGDLIMLGIGGFTPLDGFMTHADWQGVCDGYKMANGLFWPIPVTLSTDDESIKDGDDIALVDGESGEIMGTMKVTEKYSIDKAHECMEVYKTTDMEHPGVFNLHRRGDVYIGGKITLIQRSSQRDEFSKYHLDPIDTRHEFAARGWRRIVGFQTRNPIHRAHEYIQKAAMETMDGLLLHPLVGETKSDDIPANVRMRCYEVLLEHYYPKDRVLLSVLPAVMRYAGPREAIFHALVRKNYGCSHFIVGRDHAGVGRYYGTYDAQYIFDEFGEDELGITPMYFDHAFYCNKCEGMASVKTCPHDGSHHVTLSGTKVREMLAHGQLPPQEFTRPEVAQVLIDTLRGVDG